MASVDATTPRPAPRGGRAGTVAWLVCCAAVVVLVAAMWVRFDDQRSGAAIQGALVAGERPPAPPLPTRGIPRDGAPGLPAAYTQGTSTSPAAGGDGSGAGTGNGARTGAGPLPRVTVVNFWASWCGPCETEAPELQQISRDYEGRVTVVGVDAGAEDLEVDARAFVRRHGLTFPIVRGDRVDGDAWGVAGFPETFVVGTDGRISAHVNGPIDDDELRELLDRELDRA